MSDWLVQHQRIVNFSALGAGCIVAARTVLLAWPESWPWMSEAGDLLYDLGIAWVTAWAFQFLVIVMPAERERRRFESFVAPRVDRLIRLGLHLVLAVDRQLGKTPRSHFAFDSEDITIVCSTRSLSDEVPGWRGNWSEVLRSLGASAESARAGLRPFYPRLSSEVLEALDAEEDAMERLLRTERLITRRGSGMSHLEGPLFRWLSAIDMLIAVRSSILAPELPLPRATALGASIVRVP